MIIVIPNEYYVKVREVDVGSLNIEDRYLDYNINFYRESTGTNNQTTDKYKPVLDLEDVYKRDFFDELDNEYAKNAAKQNKTIK